MKEETINDEDIKHAKKVLSRSKRNEAKREAEPKPTNPNDYKPIKLAPNIESADVLADDIPVAHTPIPPYTKFPDPILAGCDEPLPEGVPDLRGVWYVYKGRLRGHIERIEQCGNRVVITGGYTIHDMRADGTLEHGVNDVSPSLGKEIRVSARFEEGRLNLRLNDKILMVTRYLDGDEIFFRYGPFKNYMRRIKAPLSS